MRGKPDMSDEAVQRLLRDQRRARGVPAPGPADPTDEAVLRYIDGAATAAERRDLAQRLARSARARDLVAILTAALPSPPVAVEEPGALRLVFLLCRDALRLVRASQPPLLVAGAAAVRGAAATTPTTYEFAAHVGELDAAVVLDRAQDRLDVRLTLRHAGAPVEDARVVALREGQLWASAPTEADGACTFAIAVAGHYRLQVRRGGVTVGAVQLDVLDEAGA
ncbi:MAG TPA: carboxypeptidase-like regulatory domain-containing protein [Polyangia bacterium]|jgi:hypothetical protein